MSDTPTPLDGRPINLPFTDKVSLLKDFKRFPEPFKGDAPLKHPQHIFAIHREAFENLESTWKPRGYMLCPSSEHLPHVFANLQQHLTLRQREWLDSSKQTGQTYGETFTWKGDRNYKQILPYCAFVYESTLKGQAKDIKIASYRRGSGGGEARLANNVSVGYGGHVDIDDVVTYNSVIDLPMSLERSMMRELNEEVQILNAEGLRVPAEALESEFNGFIIDGSNDVGQLHVAFVSFFLVPDHFSLHSNEDEIDTLRVDTVGDLLASDLPLESWTSILLKEIIARHRPTVAAGDLDSAADDERFALAP